MYTWRSCIISLCKSLRIDIPWGWLYLTAETCRGDFIFRNYCSLLVIKLFKVLACSKCQGLHFKTLEFMRNGHKENQNITKWRGSLMTAIQCCPGAYCMHTFQGVGRFRPRKRCYCWLLTFPASWRSTDASGRPVGPLQATWSCTETDDVCTTFID